MADIIISEFMDRAAVDDLAGSFDVLYDPGLVDRPADLNRLVADARALIVRNRTQVRGALLTAATKLMCIGRLGVGLDNIDLEACEARSIAVLPATGANTLSVAEYVIAGVLMLVRGSYFSSAAVAAGEWPREKLSGREIATRRLGLVGFGNIAREVARLARALSMDVVAYDPNVPDKDPAWKKYGVQPADLPTLLSSCDAVSLHIPLTRDTRHLIDARAIAAMRSDAVLINAARGGVVDERALAVALKEGRLRGAMLDVFEVEPLAAESHLVGVPNLILTPHIAGITEEANRRVSDVTAANVRRVLEGR